MVEVREADFHVKDCGAEAEAWGINQLTLIAGISSHIARNKKIRAPPCIRMGGIKDNFGFDHIRHFSQYTKVRLG